MLTVIALICGLLGAFLLACVLWHVARTGPGAPVTNGLLLLVILAFVLLLGASLGTTFQVADILRQALAALAGAG